MKNIISKNSNAKFDQKVFNMSIVEFEIVGLFEEHVVKDQIELLWGEILKLFNNDEAIKSIINIYEKGAITMIECESLVLLFARHDQKIWKELTDRQRTSTKFRVPIELVNNILNINYDPYKLSVSELKFLAKVMRLNNGVTYEKFYESDMTSFKNMLVLKTFFMKRSILESYTGTEFLENINDLKIKTVKDLICEFLQRKIIKIN